MNDNFNKIFSKKFISITLFLVVLISLLLYLISFTTYEGNQLYLTCTPEDAMGWKITKVVDEKEIPISAKEAVTGKGTAILQRQVSEDWQNYDTICFSPRRQMCIFIGKEQVYSNCGFYSSIPTTLPIEETPKLSSFTTTMDIQSSWIGKTVTVVTQNYHNNLFNSIAFDVVSSQVSNAELTAESNSGIIPGTFFAVLFLLLFGLFIFYSFEGNTPLPILLLAFAALMQMFCCLDGVINNPLFSMYQASAQTIYVLLPMLYLGLKMDKLQKTFYITTLPIWLIYFISVASWNMFALTVPTFFDKIPCLTILLVIILVIFTVILAAKGNGYFKGLSFLMVVFVIGFVATFGLSAIFSKLIFERFIIYFRELAAGYPQPLIGILFTALLFMEFILAIYDVIEARLSISAKIQGLKMQKELAYESMYAMEKTNESLAIIRHDQLSHLRTISVLCNEDAKEAAKYVTSLIGQLEAVPAMRFTQNSLVNAILSVQSSAASDKGIAFDAKVKMAPSVSLPEKDVSTVLMNLLKNAIEAASDCTDIKDAFISANLELNDNTLFISISNSLPDNFDKEDFRIKTQTKFSQLEATSGLHGFGILSASNIVSLYGGELRYTLKDNVITVNTVMSFS